MSEKNVALPAPTAWPMTLAFAVTMLAAGLVTDMALSAVGALLFVASAVGWFRAVLPHERHEEEPVVDEGPPLVVEGTGVARIPIGDARHRARLPVETYPISSGIKGGLAGAVTMAVLALLWGLVKKGSVWYPINLLAAGASAEMASASDEALLAFSARGLVIGAVIHGISSVLVGLLYGVLLPMFPRRPIFLGGVVGPLLWTGLLHATLSIVNPTLDDRVAWPWFVVTQIGFGLTAGLIVSRTSRIKTLQHLPFAVRAGVEGTGMPTEKEKS